MTVSTIDESQRKAARVAGFAYLFTFVIVVLVNFGIHERLMVAGNAAETARNILAHERLFRIGVAGDLVYEAGLVVLLSALYVILKPVGRTLALLERLVYASMWVLMSLNLLYCAEAVERCRLPAGAWNRSIPDFGEAVSLRFRRLLRWPAFLWIGIHRLQLLVLQVGLYPERIGWLRCHRLRLAAACTLAFIISPAFAKVVNLWWFDSGLGIFELATGFWLVFKGLRRGIAAPDRAQAGAA